MHGGNWSNGSGAGGFSLGLSGRHSASGIGSRAALPEFHATRTTWREFFREMAAVAGVILAFLSLVHLVMVMNERYGIVPALLTMIIILIITQPRKE